MLRIGEIVRTNYDTGPYRITAISERCECPSYLRWLDGDDSPSEAHYHLTCVNLADGHKSWLNGYRPDGTSVWNDGRLCFDGPERFHTPDLFVAT